MNTADMKFITKELEESDWFVNGEYKISKDSSIMFSSFGGGFQLLLGKGYHFSLDVDSETNRCYGFYTLTNAIKTNIVMTNLSIPHSCKAKLYFYCGDGAKLESGCHYLPFIDKCYWDKSQSILCVGDYTIDGKVIEFATDTYAKVANEQLLAVYIKLQFDILKKKVTT